MIFYGTSQLQLIVALCIISLHGIYSTPLPRCESKFGYFCKFVHVCGTSQFSNPASQDEEYIMKGDDILEGEFPSFAQLEIEGSTFKLCSAVIVSDYHLLTAGHCVRDDSSGAVIEPRYIKAVVGTRVNIFSENRGINLEVERVCPHPGAKTLKNDIAMLKLAKKLKFGKLIRPACWPLEPVEEIAIDQNSVCFQVGAGIDARVKKGGAGHSKFYIQKLRIHYKGEKGRGPGFITFRNSTGAVCLGDSGGPSLCLNRVTERWTLIGVASISACRPNGPNRNARIDSVLAAKSLQDCSPFKSG